MQIFKAWPINVNGLNTDANRVLLQYTQVNFFLTLRLEFYQKQAAVSNTMESLHAIAKDPRPQKESLSLALLRLS